MHIKKDVNKDVERLQDNNIKIDLEMDDDADFSERDRDRTQMLVCVYAFVDLLAVYKVWVHTG